jgi:hypothetical protein
MSICECSGLVDSGFLLIDAESPLLEGSTQVRLRFTGHVMLARGQIGVDAYLPFLLDGNPG